ncbi:tRNA pseudouridine(13) synthase TruD [Methanothermobacter tenebrarum]|uniref:Probable tRNA pseudouridine synthase D n=1 Tax=Methanothermobacter tenebrarum TaxID=680118 RepID=A0A328PGH0_9EURY|nr:tRNA pseudouridine(13) synthase TruD [Methanothermobacter tenebrarum]NPV65479.1 tRNA pseudouridine(13) synthase TruD [Methanobacteriaceae archaeon]RAO78494.1 tRNA pseudouridine(13) synthase TruD [Methanothermobacter tenebrarum]
MLNVETYVTKGDGTGGKTRVKYEDFYVEEIPLIQPSGQGPNTWIWMEKKGRTTLDVLLDIARELGLPRWRMGFAGMKDKTAVTRQWICISNIDPEEVKGLDEKLHNVKFLKITRHQKKLRMGQLIGNKFRIKIRGVKSSAKKEAENTLKELLEIGVPNYYGWQRFGTPRANTHLVGKAILFGDLKGAVDLYIGSPYEDEPEDIKEARKAYDNGRLEKAYEMMPPTMRYERMMLKRLIKEEKRKGDLTEESYARAIQTLPKPLKRMFVHAYQSYLFNKVVSERAKFGINKYIEGDIIVDNRQRIIHNQEPRKLDEMIKRFEAHPTAPLYGSKVPLATGKVGEIERRILKEEEITLDLFKCEKMPRLGSHGMRRPIRFRVWDTSVQATDDGIIVEFSIPKGCYATAVLREIMKKSI